ncbi:4-hydroxy-tetrahydrodipicolinate synthase [Terasakiella brassicae]|uniref:4-hydroxy-tetrahydrodipicolinate synthase n=1 Tax=Terasakiella brassicae TaxID=1634917 RepID=A0A917FE15_9PROT|nr:4-hydroxy-tetrahydrodipicolinate synthase [Terasakiella brassicae]GGF70470.1 4-hydroxy-tetrahydrodipicolinate synthase [Terasakiella brassicae]
MFQGSIPALITPFKNAQIDEQAFQDHVEWQIEQGSDALVPVGTTGESPTLSHQEHHRVVELCLEAAKGRVPVIAGTGSNNTAEAISLQKHAKKAGAAAGLVVTPYYNKPTQAGLIAHYKAIHDAVDLPIVIYNIPGRSIIDMSVETMAELSKLPNIVGVKDATGDLTRPLNTYLACGADFCQLSGEDATAVQFLSAGGTGCISVTANIAPKLCADMQRAWREGDIKTAMDIQFKLLPLHNAMFCESSPGPVKYAAELMGRCSSETRLPLVEIAETSKERVRKALADLDMI